MLLEIIDIIPHTFSRSWWCSPIDICLVLIPMKYFKTVSIWLLFVSLHCGSKLSNMLRVLKFSDFGRSFVGPKCKELILFHQTHPIISIPMFSKTDRTCQIKHPYFHGKVWVHSFFLSFFCQCILLAAVWTFLGW